MKYIERTDESAQLTSFAGLKKAGIVVVYGRRRTGKTTLIERTFSSRNIIKFEGVQNESEAFQISNFIHSLRKYFSAPLLSRLNPRTWLEAFEILAEFVSTGTWTVYLEELQWMADYKPALISHLKHVWDNHFSKNNDLLLVLCGSAPSFFETNVIRSQALYNRSMLSINLPPFSPREARAFLPRHSLRTFFDAFLTVGGIPVYLERLATDLSVVKSLAEQSFKKDSFFSIEFEKVFVSTFSDVPGYRKIIEHIGKKGSSTRDGILKHLQAESSGMVSKYLLDLELSGFIEKITPISAKGESSKLAIYKMRDPYLHFYYAFIRPKLKAIGQSIYQRNPLSAMDLKTFNSWLGFSFERFCRGNPAIFAQILGFSGIQYNAGALYNRAALNAGSGYQFDLVFQRADKVLTLCEIKYLERPVGTSVIEDFERKVDKLNISNRTTLQRVLITGGEVSKELIERHYFDRIITLAEILEGAR